jgi:dynein assembly factor 3
MDIGESIGFSHFWSFVPAQSVLDDGVSNVFVTGAGELGHILKSLGEACKLGVQPAVNFYIHDTKESIARSMLLLMILNETNRSVQERANMYAEVYGNSLLPQKTEQHVGELARELINIVTEHRAAMPVKDLFNFTNLKFKQRDDLHEVISSWLVDVPFDTETLRDNRLRFHYKQRYDYRVNLCDWDYNFHIKKKTNQIHWYHYKEFR